LTLTSNILIIAACVFWEFFIRNVLTFVNLTWRDDWFMIDCENDCKNFAKWKNKIWRWKDTFKLHECKITELQMR
jgi:hypothetical protein